MPRIVMTSKVDNAGMIHVTLPKELAAENDEVHVTIESIAPSTPMTPTEWSAWVDSMAGSWQGDFERPIQGDYEEREPLS